MKPPQDKPENLLETKAGGARRRSPSRSSTGAFGRLPSSTSFAAKAKRNWCGASPRCGGRASQRVFQSASLSLPKRSWRPTLPDAPWTPVIDSLGYSVGFLIVILGRQQLFTENTLTAVLPAMQRGKLVWWIILAAALDDRAERQCRRLCDLRRFHILHGCSWDRRAQRCDRHIRADDAETTDGEVPRWDYGRLADYRAHVDAAFIGGQRIHRHHLDDLPDRCR